MRAMEKLVAEGKIREIGVSNFSVQQTREAQEALSKTNLASNQVEYSLLERTIERDLLPYCSKEHVTIIAYSPVARGNITEGGRDERWRTLDGVGQKNGKTRAQIALNWLICKEPVVAIPKAANLEHVKENAGAAGWRLSEADQNLLSEAFR
jgi:diketogulonate reductase-like aldo/keto reductase